MPSPIYCLQPRHLEFHTTFEKTRIDLLHLLNTKT
jgi:hypothetical protein